MSDDILIPRLERLREDLNRVYVYCTEEGGRLDLLGMDVGKNLEQEVWNYIGRHLGQVAGELEGQVGELLTKVAEDVEDQPPDEGEQGDVFSPDQAWAEYRELYDESLSVLDEFSDVIVGIAFREQMLTPWLQAADHLILERSRKCGPTDWRSLTMPSGGSAIAKTLTRIIRLRFPEHWSAWGLPLTAHEYGRVLLQEDGRVPDTIRSYLTEQSEDLRINESLSKILFADSFGTFVHGPAYVAASFYLDLGTGDPARASIVMHTLRLMNEAGDPGDRPRPYDQILEHLDGPYTTIRNFGDANEADHNQVDELGDRLFGQFSGRGWFQSGAGFNVDGWERARSIEAQLANDFDDGQLPSLPEDANQAQLRDVLNAAWSLRIRYPHRIGEIGDLAKQACEAIISPGAPHRETTGQPARRSEGVA